jgi:hypothetical protein
LVNPYLALHCYPQVTGCIRKIEHTSHRIKVRLYGMDHNTSPDLMEGSFLVLTQVKSSRNETQPESRLKSHRKSFHKSRYAESTAHNAGTLVKNNPKPKHSVFFKFFWPSGILIPYLIHSLTHPKVDKYFLIFLTILHIGLYKTCPALSFSAHLWVHRVLCLIPMNRSIKKNLALSEVLVYKTNQPANRPKPTGASAKPASKLSAGCCQTSRKCIQKPGSE